MLECYCDNKIFLQLAMNEYDKDKDGVLSLTEYLGIRRVMYYV